MIRIRRHRGFTLAEILASIVILAIGLVSVVQCMAAALSTHTRAERVALATVIAQSTVEELRSTGNLVPATTTLNNPALPQGQVNVTVSTYDVTLKVRKLTVEVSWTGNRSQRERVFLETLVGNRAKHVGG